MLLSGVDAAGVSQVAQAVAQEYGSQAPGGVHSTVLTLTNVPLLVRDTQQGNGVKIYTFPAGKLVRLGASLENVQIITTSDPATTLNASVAGQFGVGTTTQANATLATTEQDIVQVTAFTTSATQNAVPAAVRAYGAPNLTVLDMTATRDIYFNIAIAGATDIDLDATVLINGVLTINWIRT